MTTDRAFLGYGWIARSLVEPPDREALDAVASGSPPAPAAGIPRAREGLEELRRLVDRKGALTAARDAAEAHWRLLENPFEPRLDPYASTYLHGARGGPALVRFRAFLTAWELVPERERFRDLEDHAAFQLDCLALLQDLRAGEPRYADAFRECLAEHVMPWMPRFLGDLKAADRELPFGGFHTALARIALGLLDADARRLSVPGPSPGDPPTGGRNRAHEDTLPREGRRCRPPRGPQR